MPRSGVTHAPPSAVSASRLVRGEPGALVEVAAHLGARAVLLSAGLAVAGCPRSELVRYSLAGAAALELFLLAWAARGEQQMRTRR